MNPTPHYLRVARALALVSGLAGLPGCAESTTLETDAGATADAAIGTDSGSAELDAGDAPDARATLDSGEEVADAGSTEVDAGLADGGNVVDPCVACTCAGLTPADAGPDSCEAIGHGECCAVIGPLFPPDLAA